MSIFKKAWNWFIHIFQTTISELENEILPFTANLLQGIKTVVENPLIDAAVMFIGNDVSDDLFQKLKKLLPSILLKLDLAIEDLSDYDTVEKVNEAINRMIVQINWETPADKEQFLSTLGANIIKGVTDHSMSFATAAMQLEYYFQHYFKPTLPQKTEESAIAG
jgi:hypothetical protein